MSRARFDTATLDEIIAMALSDHVEFENIKHLFGLSADEVKVLMRENLRSARYKAWRKRVRRLTSSRNSYK